MCSVAGSDGEGVMTSYEEWSAVADDEDHIRTIATADLMEFYANEIVQDLAHHPYADLGAHSDSDSETAAYNGLETILEETSDDMRSDSDSLRSGPASWAWSQDSADLQTVVDSGRGRDSRFEDDFNPLEQIDAALESRGKLAVAHRGVRPGCNGDLPSEHTYKQLFDFEAFLRSGGSEPERLGIGPPSPSLLPSLDTTFNTSATQYPFSDCAQVAAVSPPSAQAVAPSPTDTAPAPAPDHLSLPQHSQFRLGRVERSYYTNSCDVLAPQAAEGPPELVFGVGEVAERRPLTAPWRGSAPGAAPSPMGTQEDKTGGDRRAASAAANGALQTSSRSGGGDAKVLGTDGNGPSSSAAAAAAGTAPVPAAAGVSGSAAAEPAGRRTAPVSNATNGDSKWDLGSCEDFENLNRRIESLTYDFEEEERRSLEFIVDGVAEFEQQFYEREDIKENKLDRVETYLDKNKVDCENEEIAENQRCIRPVKRFQSFGDLSMITEDATQEGGSEQEQDSRGGDVEQNCKPAATAGDAAAARRQYRRRPALLGLLRHSSENLSEDSGYGDHAGDRGSPQDPAERVTSLPQSDSPPAARRVSPPLCSPLGRLSKSTSDLSPCTQRRRRLLELISRDEERRARLYADARLSDARHPPPIAPPLVAGDGSAAASEGDAQTDRDVESVLVLLDDEESNSVIQVLRQKVRESSREREAMAGPVPAPRSAPRAPAVYQNLPSNSRIAQRNSQPAEPTPSVDIVPDTRVKRDIEQFERIKEAFLEKGAYNIYDDMVSWRSPQKGFTRTRSTPDLSLDVVSDEETALWAESLRQTARRCFDKLTPHQTESQQPNGKTCVDKGSDKTEDESDLVSNIRQNGERRACEADCEPRDIYLSDGETQLLTMYRSSAGRPKPLDLKLAEEFLLLEGIEGDDYSANPFQNEPYGRGSPLGVDYHRGADELRPGGGASAGERGGRPVSPAGALAAGLRASGRSAAGARRSRSLWNLSGADTTAGPGLADTCAAAALSAAAENGWPRGRDHAGAWLMSKSVQELWSEDNLESPRRLDYYHQTMEWPGSGDFLALDGVEAPARASPPRRCPLNIDNGGLNGQPKFHQSSDGCPRWLQTGAGSDTSEPRSLSGHFFFDPVGGSVPQLNGLQTNVNTPEVRTMSVNNSFKSRVPLKTYGRQNEVEVYISKEPEARMAPEQPSPPASTAEDISSSVVRREKPRGVQFSPMVSEVQWRESYLDDESVGGERRSLQSFQQPERAEKQRSGPESPSDETPPPPPPPASEAATDCAERRKEEPEPARRRPAPPQPPPRLVRQPAAASPTASGPQPPPPPSVQTVAGKSGGVSGDRAAASVAAQVRAVPPPVVPPALSTGTGQVQVSSGVSQEFGGRQRSDALQAGENGDDDVLASTKTAHKKPDGSTKPATVITNQTEKSAKPEKGADKKSDTGIKSEKTDKPPKTSMLMRLGLGRLSGRSKPKPPPKPESIKATSSRSPSPRSPPPESPRILPVSKPPSSLTSSEGHPTSPAVSPQTPSQPSSQTSTMEILRSPESFGTSAMTSTPIVHQMASVTSRPRPRTPSPPSSKPEFHAPPSPAVRAKSLSLPKSAEIRLESYTDQVPAPAATAGSASSSSAVSKPPLPPQAQRTQTQANRARLTSARRNFFQLEQQRVIPLRSVPAPPLPDSAPTPGTRPSAAADIKDAFERFRQRAREDRERLAKSTPDLSLIESSTRSLVRPLPPRPAPAVRSAIDRWGGGGGAVDAELGPHSARPWRDGDAAILQAGGAAASGGDHAVAVPGAGGARAVRGYSKSKDRFAHRRAAALARARSRSVGVLETDLDAPDLGPETDLDAVGRGLQRCIEELSPPKKEKAKSLLHLDQEMALSLAQGSADGRAKSMEFLLDEENKSAVQPPENELMRGERRLSEHELRFQRSLRNLNTPDWYKKSGKPETTLRRDYGSGSLAGGWSGLNSKSTSKESLQSSRCTTPTAPSKVVIPSRVRPPGWRYVRATSRESLTSPGSGGATSPAASDRSGLYYGGGMYRAGSARLSQGSSGAQSPVSSAGGGLGGAGGRMPQRPTYMGWRSQERLNQGYQTPVERLASSFSRNRSEGNLSESAARLSLPRASSAGGSAADPVRPGPPDMDVHSSIKEVTSAIVHYFDSAGGADGVSSAGSGGEMSRGSPRPRRSPAAARGSRSASPSRRPVWLETAFVGTKPTDEPPTPEAAGGVLSEPLSGGGGGGPASPAADAPRPRAASEDRCELGGPQRRGSSVTVEDVLQSLLALPGGPAPRRSVSSSSKGSRRGASPSRVLYETSLVGTRFYDRSPAGGAPDDAIIRNNGHLADAVAPAWSARGPWPSAETATSPPDDSAAPARPNAITTVAWVSSDPEPAPPPPPPLPAEPAHWEEVYGGSKGSADSGSADHKHSGSTDNCASSGDSLQAQLSSPAGERRLSDSIDGGRGVRFDGCDDCWQPGGGGEREVTLEELASRLPLVDDTSDLELAEADTDRSAATTTPVENDDSKVHAADEGGGGAEPPDSFITIKCKNSMCLRTTNLTEAKSVFKMCHNCETFYCSRECRRAHWDRHRRVCAAIRAQTMSKQIIMKIREDDQLLLEFSRTARQGFLTHGRGLLKVFFPSPESADDFLTRTDGFVSEALYIKWQDLLPREMGHAVYGEIIELCKTYNPDSRLVLYIVICVFNEMPMSGVAKWERQIVPRCAKMKLSPMLSGRSPQRRPSPKITRELDELETLILVSLPNSLPHLPPERAREVNFLNILRHLRSRGVSLRRDYPEVYNRLCAYSEKNVPFSPTTIYPKDTGTGNTFMCLIMPDATPDQLLKIPRDCGKVKTINISQDRPE